MLIINADDFGKNRLSTDRILSCYLNKRINSTSVMVFMGDSERASGIAIENDLRTGLHLNFTLMFDGSCADRAVVKSLFKTSSFLGKNKYFSLIYNPFLRKHFKLLVGAQYDEYLRIFKDKPAHFDGHKHLHLCTNIIKDGIIPQGHRVRRNFTFRATEKSKLNYCYRAFVDKRLKKKYVCSDFFFDINPISYARIKKIVLLSRRFNVELMVHPERTSEYEYLMSEEFGKIINEMGISHLGKTVYSKKGKK